jgi:hypothetical protein
MSKVKGAPVPTRFEIPEGDFLSKASSATGLSISELVRRSVRLAKRQTEVLNGNYQFMLDLRP